MITLRARSVIRPLLVIVVALAGLATVPTPAAAAIPPNIVVIMTDDQWFDSMTCMPKTNALLAAQGVTFSNFHVSNPLCCPSRSTFLNIGSVRSIMRCSTPGVSIGPRPTHSSACT